MFLNKFLLAALLLTTGAHAQTLSPKIVGGDDAGGGYPWMAGLHAFYPDEVPDPLYALFPFCGGSLIAPGWVVTAAHCLSDGTTAQEVLVRIDQPDICDTPNCPDGSEIPPNYDAMTLLIHENYTDVSSGSDIALVQLSGKVSIDTVSIADATTMAELNALISNNGAVAVIGWGVYDGAGFDVSDDIQPENLQFVVLDYLRRTLIPGAKPANVVGAWEPSPSPITQPNGADTCFGDSGGPLFVPQGSVDFAQSADDPVLVGLTSYGSGDCDSRDDPGVYTQVSAYTDWIEQQTANQADPLVDLQVSLSHPVTDQLPGSTSNNFTVTVTNNSSRNSVSDFSVQISGEAGVGVATIGDTTLSCSQTTSIKLDCNSTGGLAPGASTVYQFSVTDNTSTIRTTTISASLTTQASDDYRRSNNSDSFDIFYTNGPDLQVDLDAFNASKGSFEMRVENNSDAFAGTDIVLTFNSNLPLGFKDSAPCMATSDTQVVCTLDTLAVSTTFTRVITLPRSRSEMLSYDLEASITQTSADPFGSNDSDDKLGFVVAKLPSSSGGGGGSALWLALIALGAGLWRRR